MSSRIDFLNGLKNLSEKDLENKILDDEMRIKKLKFAHTVSPLENPMSIRDLRKDIARTKTELHKRKLANKTENK
ncbi:MAG: 50S ribosomal protein L29 [Chitinophagaceae bacterium]|nr:50S ribosomal protein L29 [Chitinophagaceae bacterium]